MQKHLLHIPTEEAVEHLATIHHAACIDVQVGPLQMHRPIHFSWLTPLDSSTQGSGPGGESMSLSWLVLPSLNGCHAK